MRNIGFYLIALIFNVTAHAEVVKCIDPKSGSITFTDGKCNLGQHGSEVTIRQPNIADSSTDRRAIQTIKVMERKQQSDNYYRNLNRRLRSQSASDDLIKRGNDEKMRRMTSPLPNGLGTGRGCYMEHRQLQCY